MQTHSHQTGFLHDVEIFFHNLYKKVPWHLPTSVREFIVKFGPWITLVVIILALPVILLALGISTLLAPFVFLAGAHAGFGFLISGIICLLALILEVMALPGLFNRSIKSWHLIFYSVLVNAIGQILLWDIVGMIIGLGLSLYILFEIEGYYH